MASVVLLLLSTALLHGAQVRTSKRERERGCVHVCCMCWFIVTVTRLWRRVMSLLFIFCVCVFWFTSDVLIIELLMRLISQRKMEVKTVCVCVCVCAHVCVCVRVWRLPLWWEEHFISNPVTIATRDSNPWQQGRRSPETWRLRVCEILFVIVVRTSVSYRHTRTHEDTRGHTRTARWRLFV